MDERSSRMVSESKKVTGEIGGWNHKIVWDENRDKWNTINNIKFEIYAYIKKEPTINEFIQHG